MTKVLRIPSGKLLHYATPIVGIQYGALYNWYTAVDSRNITIDGWKIPALADYNTLIAYLGGESVAGGKLKELGLTNWLTPNTGATNEVLFNGRGSGIRDASGAFLGLKSTFQIKGTDDGEGAGGRTFTLGTYNNTISFYGWQDKKVGTSIRPVKISTTLTHGQTGTYTGNDGKLYTTICIDTQEWLSSNLAETEFRTGELITNVTDNSAWALLSTSAMCYYDNDINNAYIVTGSNNNILRTALPALTPIKYGLLYNWYVASDIRISTTGHVPTYDEIAALKISTGGFDVSGGNLKELGTEYWISQSVGATNIYNFNLRGGGFRYSFGTFSNIKRVAWLWTKSDYPTNPTTTKRAVYVLYQGDDLISGLDGGHLRNDGYSIRLIIDFPTNINDNNAEYVGNDGKVYPCVLIDGVWWLAANLAETRFNDGTVIPNITNNTTWAGLTTGALCAYSNDVNNI